MDLTNSNRMTTWRALHNVTGCKSKYNEYGIQPYGMYGQEGNTKSIRNINRYPIIFYLSFTPFFGKLPGLVTMSPLLYFILLCIISFNPYLWIKYSLSYFTDEETCIPTICLCRFISLPAMDKNDQFHYISPIPSSIF